MKPIKLPFGLQNNVLVHISDVEKGNACDCICPSCRSPLIAAKGKEKQHHFKHAADNECERGPESAIHLAAKQMIMEKRQIKLPRSICIASAKDSKGIEHIEQKIIANDGTIVRFDSVQEEVELSGMRVDLLAKRGNTPLIIEIFYRHEVEDQKIVKIAETNKSAIEINLSDLTQEDVVDWETFWGCINDPQRAKWLYNAKAHAVYPELEKQLATTIQLQEEKYKQEEINKEMKEQVEKEKFLQALDEVKTLSSKERIAQLQQKAETHPVWKYNAPQLPFSWHDLPDFVDVDIPNGDWIFGCDRRIWQTAFYKSFIWRNDKPFCVKNVDAWLQNKVGCRIRPCVKYVGIYGRRYPQLIPANAYANLPSSWKVLRSYFNYLWDLGMLEFSEDDYRNPGNDWFRVINKKPISPDRRKRPSQFSSRNPYFDHLLR